MQLLKFLILPKVRKLGVQLPLIPPAGTAMIMAVNVFQQSSKCKSCFNSILISNGYVIYQNFLEYSHARSIKQVPILTRNDTSSEITVCKYLPCYDDHCSCNAENQKFNYHNIK